MTKNIIIHKIVFLCTFIMIAVWMSSCETDCCDFCEDPCPALDILEDTLIVSDFESGGDPTEHCGYTGIWKDDLSHVQVVSMYDTTGGGADGSAYYAKVIITGNNGDTPRGWSGGGLTLTFQDDTAGLDLSVYTHIQLEARTLPGSHLGTPLLKLEDIRDPEEFPTPERSFPDPPLSDEWQTYTFLLDDLEKTRIGDTHEWTNLNRKNVTRLVTVSRHRGASLINVDGTLCIDNVRLIR